MLTCKYQIYQDENGHVYLLDNQPEQNKLIYGDFGLFNVYELSASFVKELDAKKGRLIAQGKSTSYSGQRRDKVSSLIDDSKKKSND